MRETQGKCDTCAVRWTWAGAPALKAATCPKCGHRLGRTSHQLKSYPTRYAVGAGRPARLHVMPYDEMLRRFPAVLLGEVRAELSRHEREKHAGLRQSRPDFLTLGLELAATGCGTCKVLTRRIAECERHAGTARELDALRP